MANHLTILRKKAGFKNAKEVSNILNISTGMIYQMEEGVKKPGINLALKMTKLYNCKLEDIFLLQNTTNSDKGAIKHSKTT
ncbi:helix-turn-helix domain-containing protein [Clostridium thermarum]|uniref:helix-turn-helix domain-containing protein n=1 Tax=Clostridium thermarum TaxID=1716543 RepID=UPI0013D20213